MALPSREYLEHIRDETTFLLNTTRELTKEAFISDPIVTRASVRSLEIIGEAVKQLPDEIRLQAPHIEWKLIARMRDHLIHRYFGVDYDIVWDALINNIPMLDKTVRFLLQKDNQSLESPNEE